jgi:hypothetical protein
MLGELMQRLDDPGTAEAVLIEMGDLVLLAEIRAATDRLGMETGDFVTLAIQRFLERADNEAWLQIVGAMGRSQTPGLAALSWILRRAVADVREAVP